MDKLTKLCEMSKNLNVLFVEDDTILQKKTTSLLKNIYAKVDSADDGEEGLNKYEEFFDKHSKYYDLIISDIKMPKLNGLELSKAIFEENKKQKIVIISAHDNSEYLIDFINIGIKKFIKKPFTSTQIIDTLYDICIELEEDFEPVIIDEIYSWDNRNLILKKEDKEIKLSHNEAIILTLFLENPGHIYSSYDLFNAIEDITSDKEFSMDSIKSIIKRLRQKLPKDFISNIYGQGYKINQAMIK